MVVAHFSCITCSCARLRRSGAKGTRGTASLMVPTVRTSESRSCFSGERVIIPIKSPTLADLRFRRHFPPPHQIAIRLATIRRKSAICARNSADLVRPQRHPLLLSAYSRTKVAHESRSAKHVGSDESDILALRGWISFRVRRWAFAIRRSFGGSDQISHPPLPLLPIFRASGAGRQRQRF